MKEGSLNCRQKKITTRWISSLQEQYSLVGSRGTLFQQQDIRPLARSPRSRAIRVYLGVKSISPSWQHANERCCKRRPTSRMRDPRDRTDNTRESTMPVSSAFLVCQAHVKARLRESSLFPSPSLSHLCLSFLFSHFPHLHPCTFPSLSRSFLSFPHPLSRCRYNRDGYKRYRRSKGLQWI